jgi:hypothetical protein
MIALARSYRSRPSSVSASWRVVRNSKRVPKCCSSAAICRLTDVKELGSDRAAADRLPASTARTKVAMADIRSIDPSVFRKGACER